MSLNNISDAELQKELKRRKGIRYLEANIDHIINVERVFINFNNCKELLLQEINRLRQGGDFEGNLPIVEEYEKTKNALFILVY